MTLLIFFALMAILTSFLCSVMEASLLSIIPSYIAQLEDKNPKLFRRLSLLKENIDQPLAAILSLNTIANTVGATGVGAQVTELYGQAYIGAASGAMTFLILTLSEILPKSIGAKYWRQLIPFMVATLGIMMFALKPFIWMSAFITRWFSRNDTTSNIKEEIKALAKMGKASNVLDDNKYRVISNIINLHEVKAKDVMTPRTVVQVVRPQTSIQEFDKFLTTTPFSRFPIVDEKEQNFLGYIHKSSSYKAADENIVDSFARPMHSFASDAHLEVVMSDMLDNHNHMALVVDQFGNWIGILTLEDILETILGKEIVDETDVVADMRQYAKLKWEKKREQKGISIANE